MRIMLNNDFHFTCLVRGAGLARHTQRESSPQGAAPLRAKGLRSGVVRGMQYRWRKAERVPLPHPGGQPTGIEESKKREGRVGFIAARRIAGQRSAGVGHRCTPAPKTDNDGNRWGAADAHSGVAALRAPPAALPRAPGSVGGGVGRLGPC